MRWIQLWYPFPHETIGCRVIAEEKICLTEVDDIVCGGNCAQIVDQADKIGNHLNQRDLEKNKQSPERNRTECCSNSSEFIQIHRIYRIQRIEPNIDFLVNGLEWVNYLRIQPNFRRIEPNSPNSPNLSEAIRLTGTWFLCWSSFRSVSQSMSVGSHHASLK